MAKQITIKDQSLQKKISIIGAMFFGELSAVEMNVMAEIITHSQDNQLNLSATCSKTIKDTLGLNQSSFSVALHRLVKKGAIKKVKSIITLPLICRLLVEENDFLIRFTPAEIKS